MEAQEAVKAAREVGSKVRVYAALIKAQAEMKAAPKSSINPAFGGKSKYADLASVAETIREPFARHGLGWRHEVWSNMDGVFVQAVIFHESGDELRQEQALFLPIPKKDPQAYKGGVTYGKRTTLEALAGIATDEDDDGNAASESVPPPPRAAPRQVAARKAGPPKPGGEEEAFDKAVAAARAEHKANGSDLCTTRGHEWGLDGVCQLCGQLEGEAPARKPAPMAQFGPKSWFNDTKGMACSELTTEQRRKWVAVLQKQINDPSKASKKAANEKQLEDVLAVMDALGER